jgi:hypothetical protein
MVIRISSAVLIKTEVHLQGHTLGEAVNKVSVQHAGMAAQILVALASRANAERGDEKKKHIEHFSNDSLRCGSFPTW